MNRKNNWINFFNIFKGFFVISWDDSSSIEKFLQ